MTNGPGTSPRALRFFLIDDNVDDIFFATRALLESWPDCHIDMANDGRQALALLSAGYSPDLILLDLNLPGMDGLEILHSLRSRPGYKTIPIVVVSSSTLERDILQSLAAGATSYLHKSIDFKEFSCSLRRVIEEALRVLT